MTLLRCLRSALARRPACRTRPPARRLAVELLEDRLTPSTGGLLDPTFGSGGHVLTSFSNFADTAYAVTTQADGKVVIAGFSATYGSKTGHDFLVARYNADGSVDTAFGTGGRTVTDFGSSADAAYAVALQPQTNGPSKILVAGYDGGGSFAVARYNANGTLDTTFGGKTGNGKVTTGLGGSNSCSESMVVDGAGRILVAGSTTVTGAGTVAALVRYTANGALDTTFGSGGKLITTIQVQNLTSHVPSVALQTDGQIVLAGTTIDPATSSVEFVLARFNTDGTADTGFGSGGVLTTHPGYTDHFGGVALQGDGKIVVSGSEASGNSPPALYLLRYNANGTPDTSFGTGGLVAVAPPAGPGVTIDAHGSGVAVQADGKIVGGGQFYDTTAQQWDLAALRVNPDGTVDTGYGSGGWATVQFAFNDSLTAIALEPDGRLLLAGSAKPTSTGPTEVALVRFLASAPQVGSFTASPDPVASGGSTTLTASNVSDANPGATVTQVAFYVQLNGGNTLLGYGTQSSPGVWTFSYTVSLTSGTYTLIAQATDSYGVLGDPLALSLQVA